MKTYLHIFTNCAEPTVCVHTGISTNLSLWVNCYWFSLRHICVAQYLNALLSYVNVRRKLCRPHLRQRRQNQDKIKIKVSFFVQERHVINFEELVLEVFFKKKSSIGKGLDKIK